MDDIKETEYQKGFDEEDCNPFMIEFYYNSRNVLYGFLALGETGFNLYGTDIVAAGVSALIINTVNSLRLLTDEPVEYEMRNNFVKCNLPRVKANKGSKEGLILLRALRLGMESIQGNYGNKHMKIKETRDEKKRGLFFY